MWTHWLIRVVFVSSCASLLLACGGNSEVSNLTPAVDSDKNLALCLDPANNRSCTLTLLPLIGQETTTPSVDHIMARVVTSHDWMADNFRQVLNRLPLNVRRLMRSITGIVIKHDIRPSYYWSQKGAIYIDPHLLWLTQAQKADIDTNPDFRNDFGKDLQYITPWRYVKNNDYAVYYYPLDSTEQRTLDDITPALAVLLFHELTHAADVFPVSSHAGLNKNQRIVDLANARTSQYLSRQANQNYPLSSQPMHGLAEVLFQGRTATQQERGFTPQQVGDHFAGDVAVDDYNYSTQFEDLAMLMEELFMDFHFDIERDFAMTDKTDDLIVAYGTRHRIAEPSIKEKAASVLAQLLPEEDFSAYLASLQGQKRLRSGASWQANLEPEAEPSNANTKALSQRQRLVDTASWRYPADQ